jgi:hypothetical protein
MIDALETYKLFIATHDKQYRRFLEKQMERRVQAKRQEMDELLKSQFPYPVSNAFSAFEHELDYHRKFQLMLQVFEIIVKYSALVGLAGYLLAKEQSNTINTFLSTNFKRPSLGDWAHLLGALLKESPGFDKLLCPLSTADVTAPRGSFLGHVPDRLTLEQLLGGIVRLRNSSTGHGAIRTLYEYRLIIEQEEERLYSVFDRLSFLATGRSFLVLKAEYDEFGEGDRYKIRILRGFGISDTELETPIRLSEGQRETMIRYIYFQNTLNSTIVNLYPFISYMFCDNCRQEQFFFYNSLKADERTVYLSYSCGHSCERDNGAHFRKRLNTSSAVW